MTQTIKIVGAPLFEVYFNPIFSKNGVWQEKYRVLQDHYKSKYIISLFSYSTKEHYEDAIYGYVLPFMKDLTLNPETCLLKIGGKSVECCERNFCTMYNSKCSLQLGMSLCFELCAAESIIDVLIRDIIRGWSENKYWVVIRE